MVDDDLGRGSPAQHRVAIPPGGADHTTRSVSVHRSGTWPDIPHFPPALSQGRERQTAKVTDRVLTSPKFPATPAAVAGCRGHTPVNTQSLSTGFGPGPLSLTYVGMPPLSPLTPSSYWLWLSHSPLLQQFSLPTVLYWLRHPGSHWLFLGSGSVGILPTVPCTILLSLYVFLRSL